MTIAIAGKGGVGKTYIAANLAKLYASHIAKTRYGGRVYAVDADPCGGLGAALGISKDEVADLKPIIDMREFIDTGEDDGALYLHGNGGMNTAGVGGKYDVVSNGVRFLRMSGVKQAGAGCYCHEHNFLQAILKSITLEDRDTLILDMSAGVEHLARGTVRDADVLLVVTEATRACIETTRTIQSLGAGLGVKRIYTAANKIRNEKEELLVRANFRRGELIGLVRMSEAAADSAIGISAGDGQDASPGADMFELFRALRSVAGAL